MSFFFLFNYSKSCDFGISAHLIFVLCGVICGTEACHLEFYDLFLELELCMWTNSFPQTTAEDRQQLSWLTSPSALPASASIIHIHLSDYFPLSCYCILPGFSFLHSFNWLKCS